MEGKVLVASRDEGCQKILCDLFKSQKLTVKVVADEADLLLAILNDDYVALIYDLDFSQLNSLKMVKILRKIRPKISLVVLSNDPSKELGGKILQEGVTYFGTKPIYPEAISKAVLGAMSQITLFEKP